MIANFGGGNAATSDKRRDHPDTASDGVNVDTIISFVHGCGQSRTPRCSCPSPAAIMTNLPMYFIWVCGFASTDDLRTITSMPKLRFAAAQSLALSEQV